MSPRSGAGTGKPRPSMWMPMVPGWPTVWPLYCIAPDPASLLKCGAIAVAPFAAAGGRPVVRYRGMSGLALLARDQGRFGRPRGHQRIGHGRIGPQVSDDQADDDGPEQ